MVVSQTPGEALIREWEEHNIQDYVRLIADKSMEQKLNILNLRLKENILMKKY